MTIRRPRFLESLNPSLKGLAVMLCALMLSLSYRVAANLWIFGACIGLLLFFSGCKPWRAVKLLLPVLPAAVGFLFTGLYFSREGAVSYQASLTAVPVSIGSLYNGMQLATRVFAFAGLGLLFSLTTKAQGFIYSLQRQLRLPPKFAYGILAAVHLLPNIREEYGNARLALAVRGAAAGPLSMRPVFCMFVNAVRWSEMLSIAMESRGFDGDGARTYYQVPVVRARDFLFLGGSFAAVLCAVLCAGF